MFYDFMSGEDPEEDPIVIWSEVYGRMSRKGFLPQSGNGFGFYHTVRAVFPRGDRFRRRPRISLIGTLLDLEHDGRELISLEVEIERRILRSMQSRPIIRDDSTEEIFQMSGLVRGCSASLFEVPPKAWEWIVAHVV